MPRKSERIRGFTESVIRRMTRIANQHGAINLSQGFPDFDPLRALPDADIQAGLPAWMSVSVSRAVASINPDA